MEHKPCKATRRAPRQEPVHHCGSCANYTESYEVKGVWFNDEHCLAGCTYEQIRHCVSCDKWERSQYA